MNGTNSGRESRAARERSILTAGALGAGFINGLLGAGGGVALYFTLRGLTDARDAKEDLILSSTAVAFYCLVSLYFYGGNAAFDAEDILRIGVPAACGGLTGAYLLRRVPQYAAQKLFAVVLILGGLLMLTR